MKELSEMEVLHRCAAYCSTAERCVQDVKRKMKNAGLPEEACGRLLARLQEGKYIDEERYARSFVNDKLRFNKWGRAKILYELQKKGIPSAICNDALSSIDETEYINLLFAVLEAKGRSLRTADGTDLYRKLMRFAQGRGFGMRESSACLKRLLKDVEYDDME